LLGLGWLLQAQDNQILSFVDWLVLAELVVPQVEQRAALQGRLQRLEVVRHLELQLGVGKRLVKRQAEEAAADLLVWPEDLVL